MVLEERVKILEDRCGKIDPNTTLLEIYQSNLEEIISECSNLIRKLKTKKKSNQYNSDDAIEYFNTISAELLSIRSQAKQKLSIITNRQRTV